MSDDIVTRLRAMARAEHDDVSVAADAADEIERLRENARYGGHTADEVAELLSMLLTTYEREGRMHSQQEWVSIVRRAAACLPDLIAEIGELRAEREDLARTVGELRASRRWIPVSERLPEDAEVLCWFEPHDVYRDGGTVIAFSDGDRWDAFDFECWPSWAEHITHWMPLPEPPQ